MLSCFYYWKCKTDLLSVTYIELPNFLTYVETPLPTTCYSSTYPKDILSNYVS